MWDTKYRPLKFAEVLGQTGSVQLLKARLKKGTAFDTNYIFAGGHGQGKTTLARIHARAMLCQQLNVADPEPCNECDNCRDMLNEQPGAFVERDAASQGTIEHIRGIVDELPFAVYNAPKRIYLFDEAHRMGIGAQDVLLKPLEEKKMVGIFCTTEPEKIRGPIRSRCEEYTIRKVTRDDILARMRDVLSKENVEYQDDAVLIVIDYSGGHVRDVLNRLEMISQTGPITVDSVREYLRLSVVSTYYEILLALADPKRAMELVDQACERVSAEEVATGVAEAAMNSYRIANNMFADFVYVDRSMGVKVFEKYGPNVVRFAEWFLRFRYSSKIALLRDIVVFGQTAGNLPPEGAQPPVVFSVTGNVSPAPVSVPALAQAPVQTSAPATQPTQPSPVAAPASKRYQLHKFESQLPLDEMPRMEARESLAPLNIPDKNSEDEDKRQLSPDEWRQRFKASWPARGG